MSMDDYVRQKTGTEICIQIMEMEFQMVTNGTTIKVNTSQHSFPDDIASIQCGVILPIPKCITV